MEIPGVLKLYWKPAVIISLLVASFAAGTAWNDRAWSLKWAQRDRDENAKTANAQTAARMIEQGRTLARDKAVQDAQQQAAAASATADILGDTVSRLQQQAKRISTQLDAAKHTADLASAVGSKTATGNAAMLADVLGRVAEDAKYYAGRSDESRRAGLTCERIYNDVMTSNNKGP